MRRTGSQPQNIRQVANLLAIIKDALGLVIPPESCPFDFIDINEDGPLRDEYHKARRDNRMWRWKMAGAILILLGFCVWVVFMSDYTRAADVDTRVEAAVKPIQSEMMQVKNLIESATQTNATLTKAIIEQLAAREADTICRTLGRQKKETDYNERRRLRGEADEAQERYREFKKDYYPESRCEG